MVQREFIDSLLEEGKNIAENVEKKFLGLSPEVLNKRPAPESWSAAECFKHLYDTNESYLQKAGELFPQAEKSGGDHELKHSLFGRFIIKSVSPQNKSRYKTSKDFNPINSNVDSDIVKNFLDQHKILLGEIENGRDINLSKIKVASPFTKFIKYHFADAFKILIEHDKRHIAQAERAIKS